MTLEFITVWLLVTHPTIDDVFEVWASATPVDSIHECRRRGDQLMREHDEIIARCLVTINTDRPLPIIALPSTRGRVVSEE